MLQKFKTKKQLQEYLNELYSWKKKLIEMEKDTKRSFFGSEDNDLAKQYLIECETLIKLHENSLYGSYFTFEKWRFLFQKLYV